MPTALLISNQPASRDYLLNLVECAKLFPQTACARDSQESLTVLREQEIDVIFYDWQPPDLSEVSDLVEHLHEHDEWFDIPLILFTPRQQTEAEVLALKHGACDCLGYSITAQQLAARLNPHLAHKKRADALREENSQLAKLAITDRLTGLHNRSYFDLIFDFEASRSQRQGTVLSLLVLAIDQYSTVVDQYGHGSGDNLLRMVSDVVHGTLRQSDIACRFSHQEFAVILPDTAVPAAYCLSERIRKEICRQGPKPPMAPFSITVSIGISGTVVASSIDPSRLVDEAFCAVEAGQRNGANRTEIFCHHGRTEAWEVHNLDLELPQGHA